jgi:nucleotide-binding universal stress UspA family protein
MRSSPHSAIARLAATLALLAKGGEVATIVCAFDDSPGAVEALRVANALSAGFGVRLVLAHAASGFSNAAESLSTVQALQGGTRLLKRTAREHKLAAEQRVEVGEPAEVLSRIAAEEGATVIVVGSRRQGRRRPKLRSVLAEDLAATASCPVVVVPPPPRR